MPLQKPIYRNFYSLATQNMTAETQSFTPPTPDRGSRWPRWGQALGTMAQKGVEIAITAWHAPLDHLYAPDTSSGAPVQEAATRVYREILKAIRTRRVDQKGGEIQAFFRAEDPEQDVVLARIVAGRALASRLLGREAENAILRGHGTQKEVVQILDEKLFKPLSISIEKAEPTQEPEKPAAIAAHMAAAIRENQRTPEGPLFLHLNGRWGWKWHWNQIARGGDQRNSALERKVIDVLMEKHDITIGEFADEGGDD